MVIEFINLLKSQLERIDDFLPLASPTKHRGQNIPKCILNYLNDIMDYVLRVLGIDKV